MIIIRLYGGIGNQMFQYAFGKSLALSRNCKLRVDTSILTSKRELHGVTNRNYDLDIFEGFIQEFNFNSDLPANYKIYNVYERNFPFDPDRVSFLQSLPFNSVIMLTGYWQSEKYFLGHSSEVISDFKFKEKLTGRWLELSRIIESTDSVMVNVRRTDYLQKLDYHGVVTTKYLNEAMQRIRDIEKRPQYFIFSDDIGWCRGNLPLGADFIFVDESYYDRKYQYYLQLMTLCKHFILANSSFSWWSAYLGKKENSSIIAPVPWFTAPIDTMDLIPKSWTKMSM